jgi:hypothetical protein
MNYIIEARLLASLIEGEASYFYNMTFVLAAASPEERAAVEALFSRMKDARLAAGKDIRNAEW